MSHEYVQHSTHCACVFCSVCDGTGCMPAMAKTSNTMVDEYSDLIPCDDCTDGIVEECEACHEREMKPTSSGPEMENQAA